MNLLDARGDQTEQFREQRNVNPKNGGLESEQVFHVMVGCSNSSKVPTEHSKLQSLIGDSKRVGNAC